MLASKRLPRDDEADAAKRPSVQVGDPFEEKRLIEACLALLDADLVVGIQDLGGAGLNVRHQRDRQPGGVGMDVHVSEVPQREAGMEPFEVMTSESQERMLAIVEPAPRRGAVDLPPLGRVRRRGGDGHRRRATWVLDRPGGRVLADVPAAALHEDAPLLDRPRRAHRSGVPAGRCRRRRTGALVDAGADLLDMLYDTSWVWSQHDHQLFLNTVEGPGATRPCSGSSIR